MAQQVIDNNKFSQVRLPRNLIPKHYDLFVKPNLENFVFDGIVNILFEDSNQTTNTVILHSLDLKIIEGQLIGQDNSTAKLIKVTYSPESEVAVLEFEKSIQCPTKICLTYSGIHNDKMKGFYRTTMKVGETQLVGVTTKFEPTDARRCLPCWDEPNFKATYLVSVEYDCKPVQAGDRQYPIVALSNQSVSTEKQVSETTKLTFFKVTPKMSSYLLAIIVGPFEYVEKFDGKRLHRVYTVPGKKEQGEFALDVSCKSLRFYEEYFNIEYPLDKMDLVAIADFASGAMENWGLVTYRESRLLYDPSKSSLSTKQEIALTVTHENSHQWFGNLVTMQWWTHLWLNEGFAAFMEYLCVDHLFPECVAWNSFVTDSKLIAMELDSLHNSHPIEVPVEHPGEIREIFDAISYCKGSSVLRMLHNFIGDDAFRRGLHNYLTKYSYSNAATEDLWRELESTSGKPVCKLMSCWTSQRGYPWISVQYEANEAGDAKFALEQQQFTADGELHGSETSAKWVVPIAVSSDKDPDGKESKVELLEDYKGTFIVPTNTDGWLKLNPNTIGLYRVVYPEGLTSRLVAAVASHSLPAMDRLNLQNDCHALCSAGKISTVSVLELLKAYKGETNYSVWSSVDRCINQLSMLLMNAKCLSKFETFARHIYEDIFAKLTWDVLAGEPEADARLRSLVINRLVSLGDEKVVAEAIKRYKAQQAGETDIPADIKAAVYKAVSKFGEDSLFEQLISSYDKSNSPEEKDRIGRCLGFCRRDRLPKVIEFAMSDVVKSQDKIFVLIYVGFTDQELLWQTFKEKRQNFIDMFGVSSLLIAMVKYSCENFSTQAKYEEVKEYFEKNDIPGCKMAIQQSLEKIAFKVKWLERDGEAINSFFLK